MDVESSLSKYTKITILAITFIQAVLLYFLIEYKVTLTNYFGSVIFAFVSVTYAAPLFAVLLLSSLKDKFTWYILVVYTFIVFLLAWYTGEQCSEGSCSQDWINFIFPHIISGFILLFFSQVWLESRTLNFSYRALFNASWENYLTVKLTAIFVVLFWGLLALWIGLFKLINILFFDDLFYSEEFSYPVTGIVIGLGIIVFRSQINAVDMVRRILRVLIRWLLPVISFISIIFIVTVPFAGLESLWETKKATALLLWLACLVLFFTNAVYQDGENEGGYGRVVSGLIKTSLFSLPVYILIAAYALGLRVMQYGWSIDRLWVALIIIILSGFIFSYAYHLIRNHKKWLGYFAKTNQVMAMVMAVSFLLVTSPILDFRKITVNDQLVRLKSGKVNLENFDYKYFHFELGKPGHDALVLLREKNKKNKKVFTVINNTLNMEYRWDIQSVKLRSAEHLSRFLPVLPAGNKAPELLFEYIYNNKYLYSDCNILPTKCFLLAIDIYGNKAKEYILFYSDRYAGNAKVFIYKNNQWTAGGVATESVYFNKKNNIAKIISEKRYNISEHNWKDLMIGDKRIIFKNN